MFYAFIRFWKFWYQNGLEIWDLKWFITCSNTFGPKFIKNFNQATQLRPKIFLSLIILILNVHELRTLLYYTISTLCNHLPISDALLFFETSTHLSNHFYQKWERPSLRAITTAPPHSITAIAPTMLAAFYVIHVHPSIHFPPTTNKYVFDVRWMNEEDCGIYMGARYYCRSSWKSHQRMRCLVSREILVGRGIWVFVLVVKKLVL